jgi:PAS domain S-box-containing protein
MGCLWRAILRAVVDDPGVRGTKPAAQSGTQQDAQPVRLMENGMNKRTSTSSEARQGAEARFRKKSAYPTKVPEAQRSGARAVRWPKETRVILRELRMHQIELERQNEELRQSQITLDAERRRYFDFYNLAPVGYVTVSEQAQILQANHTASNLLGVARGTLVRQLLTRFICDEDHGSYYWHCRQLFASGEAQSYELRMLKNDSTKFWAQLAASVAQEADGAPAIRLVLSDITERKEQEEKTRQLLTENQTILRSALVGIVFVKQRRIVSCNRRLEEIFKYEPGELIGESTERLYDCRATFDKVGRDAYKAVSDNANFSTEIRLRHKDGSVFWGALTGRAIDPLHPNDGSIWIYADISERRRAEEESRKLQQAVEQSPVSIVITNRDGVIEYVNPSFTRISGYADDEVIGQPLHILKTGDVSDATQQDLWHTLLDGRIWHGILHNLRKNGELIWEDSSIAPIFNTAGEITNFVAVNEDVTERKRVEQQLEAHQTHLEDLVSQRTAELSSALEAAKLADHTKDEFLAHVSHELRTPLSAVIGFSSLARPISTDARQREYLDKVNSAGKTLASIIDDLLDLSKIVAGRMEFEIRAFSLRQLIMRSASVISYKAQEKDLELVQQIDEALPDILVGDSLRVEQILLNLLSNAVKFTSAGKVELRVDQQAVDAQRICLNIEVEDQGIGLREDEIALLFKPFSQADVSTTRKYGGTGLGLMICKRLAELMDGEISVSSREGRGTTFRVRIWLGLGKAGELPAAEEEADESAQVRYQDVRMLVVDDQPFNRDVVQGLLGVVGISPRLASNGQEALDILSGADEAFDLVMMDVQMPVMDGLTATRAIRSLARFAALPIIAMTAHTMAHERVRSVAAGMNDHVGKPFDEAGFYRVLAKWIPRSKQRVQAVAETPALVAIAANGLPPLRGVDTRAGLALLQGDEARYRHWLSDFAAQAPAAIEQIRRDLAAGKPEPASMAAHTLKGRAGLLGMNDLYLAAGALEAGIDSTEVADERLLHLEQGIVAVCEEIRSRLGLDNSFPPMAEDRPDERPSQAPPPSVAQLIARLRAGDGDCDRLVTDCLAELEGTTWAPHLRQALIHAENFDFASASSLLADCWQQQT